MGETIEIKSGKQPHMGYLAKTNEGGPAVLVLHAWWGLNDFVRQFCDRLAEAGFVALAPDLYGDGRTVDSIEQAQARVKSMDYEAASQRARAGVRRVLLESDKRSLGVVGFSLGAAYAIQLLTEPAAKAVVLFYGLGEQDAELARRTEASLLGHFAENDEYEPLEAVKEAEKEFRDGGMDVTFHIYEGVGHWFLENDRADAFDENAAEIAWTRTLEFLREKVREG